MAAGRLSPTYGGEEAGYLFEFKSDGVYLTVYPENDSGVLYELSDMIQVLKDYGVEDYEMETLVRTVRSANGITQKLADKFTGAVEIEATGDPEIDRKFLEELLARTRPYKIDVNRDKMAAFIRFDRKAGGIMPSAQQIRDSLEAAGIVFGISEEAIANGLEEGRDFLVAKGVAPVNGQDAKIIKMFDLSKKGRPKADEFDRVDYKDLSLFVLAKVGDKLAERVPHTLGTPGTDVYGNEVAAKPGKAKPVPAGKNTEVRDENFVVATMDGQISDNGNLISIDPKLDIKGDVGVGTGNIDFAGAVYISGSVQLGFSVKASGDVEINGMVSGGNVEACNVFVKGGIQGQNRGKVKAMENINASFAENAELEAGGSIFINDVSLHSNLQAGEAVVVEGKRGLVTGGTIAAGREVKAKVIGNQMNVVTRLLVGVNPMLQRRYKEVCKEYGEAKKKLKQITNSLKALGEIDINTLPPQRVKMLRTLIQAQMPLSEIIERDEYLMQDMLKDMEKMEHGRIKVSDILYPGVRITINNVMKNVQEEQRHCSLYVEGDEIVTGNY